MRLDARQVRFVPSFLPTWRTRTLRLGGRRGGLHLQEPALVLEGELLRFRLVFGIEWLFRQALSEWTTVTVPYSRIVTVRRTWAWLVRFLLVLAIAQPVLHRPSDQLSVVFAFDRSASVQVNGASAADQWLAAAKNQLDGLHCLDCPHDARQHTQNAPLGAARYEARRRRF